MDDSPDYQVIDIIKKNTLFTNNATSIKVHLRNVMLFYGKNKLLLSCRTISIFININKNN